jgi:hypothetical protein
MSLELKPAQQEVLDQAFAIIHEQYRSDDWMLDEKDAIASQIEEGFQQAVRGELIDADQAIDILRDRRAKLRTI